MASTVPSVPNDVCIVIRHKMSEEHGGIVGGALFCHCGETNDVFLLGGSVETGETLMTDAIRCCQHVVNFRFNTQNYRLYLAKVLNQFMNHEPVKLSFFTGVLFCNFKWRARHHTPALAVVAIDKINEEVTTLRNLLSGPVPPIDLLTSIRTELCGIVDEFSICHWDDIIDKSKCFDFGELTLDNTIEDNLGIDVGIVLILMDIFPMRDNEDINGIQAEAVKIMRTRIFYRDFQINDFGSGQTNMSPNMSRFLQKLEHQNGENAKTLHGHLNKQSK